MKYKVTYQCGHEGTVNLSGPWRDRERKLEWYKNTAVCPECYKQKQKLKESKDNAPLVITINVNPELQDGQIVFSLVASENAQKWRLKLKEYGFKKQPIWDYEYMDGSPYEALSFIGNKEEAEKTLQAIKPLTDYKTKNDINYVKNMNEAIEKYMEKR